MVVDASIGGGALCFRDGALCLQNGVLWFKWWDIMLQVVDMNARGRASCFKW